jgi:hypothetical protein
MWRRRLLSWFGLCTKYDRECAVAVARAETRSELNTLSASAIAEARKLGAAWERDWQEMMDRYDQIHLLELAQMQDLIDDLQRDWPAMLDFDEVRLAYLAQARITAKACFELALVEEMRAKSVLHTNAQLQMEAWLVCAKVVHQLPDDLREWVCWMVAGQEAGWWAHELERVLPCYLDSLLKAGSFEEVRHMVRDPLYPAVGIRLRIPDWYWDKLTTRDSVELADFLGYMPWERPDGQCDMSLLMQEVEFVAGVVNADLPTFREVVAAIRRASLIIAWMVAYARRQGSTTSELFGRNTMFKLTWVECRLLA